MKAEDLRPGLVVSHAKGGVYQIIGPVQVKIDGIWHDFWSYCTTESRLKRYARRPDDFGKFSVESVWPRST